MTWPTAQKLHLPLKDAAAVMLAYWSWKDMWRHREQDVRTVRNEARCPTNGTLHGRDCGYHDEAFCKIPQSPSWS